MTFLYTNNLSRSNLPPSVGTHLKICLYIDYYNIAYLVLSYAPLFDSRSLLVAKQHHKHDLVNTGTVGTITIITGEIFS